MQEPYRRILEKRRAQIVEQVRWNRELATGLDKYGLLSKEDLRYVETEQSSQSRVYAALTRIVASDEPRTFGRFCRLLDELGNKSMAESLDFDRQRIRWNFDKELNATCLPNYIDLVNAQLLDSALTEQDDYTCKCLIGVVKRRLEDLRNCLRQQQRDRNNFRVALWETISGKKVTLSSLSYRPKGAISLSEIEDTESARDEVLLEKTKGLVELIRLRVIEQKRENEGLMEVLRNNNISPDKKLPLPSVSNNQLFGSDEDLFTSVSTDDAAQGLTDDWNIDKKHEGTDAEKKLVHIDRSVFDQILQILKPFETHGSIGTRQREDFVSQIRGSEDIDPSVSKLIDLLQSMESELEMWRNRSHRLSSELKSLEHEQQLVSTALLGVPSSPVDREVRLETILHKIAELGGTVVQTETTGEIHSHHIDDQTAHDVLDSGRSRRSSANEDLGGSRTKTDQTTVDIDTARRRRMSVPAMRIRPSISNTLPVQQDHQRNKNAFTYRKSSRDYSSVATTKLHSEQKTTAGKFPRRGFDLSQFRQGNVDARPFVAITVEPSAMLSSPNNRRRKALVKNGQKTSIDSLNDDVLQLCCK